MLLREPSGQRVSWSSVLLALQSCLQHSDLSTSELNMSACSQCTELESRVESSYAYYLLLDFYCWKRWNQLLGRSTDHFLSGSIGWLVRLVKSSCQRLAETIWIVLDLWWDRLRLSLWLWCEGWGILDQLGNQTSTWVVFENHYR